MPTLFQAEGKGWKLEVVGKLPDLPPFLKQAPDSIIETTGEIQMARFDPSSGCLRPIACGEKMTPLFFEAVGYDIHFEKDDPLVTINLPAGTEPRRTRPTSEHHFLKLR